MNANEGVFMLALGLVLIAGAVLLYADTVERMLGR